MSRRLRPPRCGRPPHRHRDVRAGRCWSPASPPRPPVLRRPAAARQPGRRQRLPRRDRRGARCGRQGAPYTAGTGDLATGALSPATAGCGSPATPRRSPPPSSCSWSAEGKIDLDAPVEHYLPGLVRGQGQRRAADHRAPAAAADERAARLRRRSSPKPADRWPTSRTPTSSRASLLDAALAEQPALRARARSGSTATPTTSPSGLIVERVTGRPIGEEITRRVIEPAGLRRHLLAARRVSSGIRGAPPARLLRRRPGRAVEDMTTAGPVPGLGRRPAGLHPGRPRPRSWQALLGGRLLQPAQLAEMQTDRRARRASSPTRAGATAWASRRHGLACGGTRGGTAATSRASRPATWSPRTGGAPWSRDRRCPPRLEMVADVERDRRGRCSAAL